MASLPIRLRFALPVLAGVAAFALAGPPAAAQQAGKPEQNDKPAQDGALLPPAYDAQMMRLAEILGSLHYLRNLCGAKEGQRWRDEMQTMLDKEQPTAKRRAELIARFNRGFRGYKAVYRECTPAAAEAANRYLRQGIRLAAEIPTRYGR